MENEKKEPSLISEEHVRAESASKSFMTVRELTIAGLLSGITVFLGVTGYGFIPLGFMHATILQIPTIIGTLVAGPRVGILVGLLFGMFSFVQSVRAPSIMMQFVLQYSILYDALICIAPRMCIALAVWGVYRFFPGKSGIKIAMSSVVGSLTNTILFLGAIFFFVGAPYAEAQHLSIEAVGILFLGIVTMNGIPEAVVSGLIVTPIVMALQKNKSRNK